ncbi:MAG TPA: hypothetical protein VFZ37_15550 [Jiangellaceae bacterium]
MTMPVAVGAFVAAAAVIAVAGTLLSRVVDRLADRTGLGEAMSGMILLGAVTSLAGLVVSLVAAVNGNASLAVSNSMGGIAIQTLFIVIADATYRRVNLEHAAASLTNIFNSVLLLVMLAIVIVGVAAPPVSVLGVHPATLLLFAAYGYGLFLGRKTSESPMWRPAQTSATREDVPDPDPPDERLAGLWIRFGLLAMLVVLAGYGVFASGTAIGAEIGMSNTVVGAFLTGVATSLPELVTTVAAVRAGALTLAVAGIVGGNVFDVLFVAASDVVYRDGSIYAAVTQADVFTLGWTLLMAGIVTAGLVLRERGGIGFEGVAVTLVYVAGLATVSAMG